MPPQFHTRKAHLKEICPECQQLQDQLNDGTDSIVEILNRKFADPNETLLKLNKAQDERNQVIRKLVRNVGAGAYFAFQIAFSKQLVERAHHRVPGYPEFGGDGARGGKARAGGQSVGHRSTRFPTVTESATGLSASKRPT